MEAWGAPFTAQGLLRLAALVAVITLAPMVLWLSVGLHPATRAAVAGLGWQEVWALYGSSVEHALRLACACTAAVMLLAVPSARAVLQRRAAWRAPAGTHLQRPVAVPAVATALALVLAAMPSLGPLPDFVTLLVAHLVLTLPFAVLIIAATSGGPVRSAGVQAGAATSARTAISACLLAFALSLGESSLTALLDVPLAPPRPASLTTLRSEAGTVGAAMVVAIALPLLWGMQLIAEALGLRPFKPSWADRS